MWAFLYPMGVGYRGDAICGHSCARMGVGYSSNVGNVNVPIISSGLPLHKDLGFLRNSFHSDSLEWARQAESDKLYKVGQGVMLSSYWSRRKLLRLKRLLGCNKQAQNACIFPRQKGLHSSPETCRSLAALFAEVVNIMLYNGPSLAKISTWLYIT